MYSKSQVFCLSKTLLTWIMCSNKGKCIIFIFFLTNKWFFLQYIINTLQKKRHLNAPLTLMEQMQTFYLQICE